MSKQSPVKIVDMYCKVLRRSSQDGLSMRLRLFLFLILFLNTIMLGVFLVLLSTGIFKAGQLEHKPVIESELTHIARDIYQAFGAVSVQAVELAEGLSASVERNLKEHGGSAAALQETPDLLEHLLDEELGRLTGALERSRGSGVFLLLNATVNPTLPGAEESRACLYLKNMEPNIINGMPSNLRLGFGPMAIARNNDIRILPQWQMELDAGEMPDLTELMAVKKEQTRPLSRLYRWSEGKSLPGSSERMMLCSVPLVASDGTVFGLCGFEVSEMLFKLSYTPRSERFNHLICLLSPLEENTLRLSGALFTGDFSAGPSAPEHTEMGILSDTNAFYTYLQAEKETYSGLHQAVTLYPADSEYADEQWAVVLMMPAQELDALTSMRNRNLGLSLLALMLLNIGLAAFISQKYIRPVVEALEHIKQPNPASKTKIPEIDDLIEFLAAQDEVSALPERREPPVQEYSALYHEFVKNIQTLSAAEKAVFDLYVQGHTAWEIAEILCLSINTIKTHNRRIYMKLNVTSRKELMVYIQMIAETKTLAQHT